MLDPEPFVPPWRTYLENLQRFGATHSLRQIRKLSHCHANQLAHYRRSVSEFKEKEAELLKLFKNVEALDSTPREKESALLPRLFRVYLQCLDKHNDRIEACKEAGLTWGDVVEALERLPEFKRRYDAWLQVQNIRLEDAQVKKGLGGDSSAARAVLQARDPRYRGRGPSGGEAPPTPEEEEISSLLSQFRAKPTRRSEPLEVTDEDMDGKADA